MHSTKVHSRSFLDRSSRVAGSRPDPETTWSQWGAAQERRTTASSAAHQAIAWTSCDLQMSRHESETFWYWDDADATVDKPQAKTPAHSFWIFLLSLAKQHDPAQSCPVSVSGSTLVFNSGVMLSLAGTSRTSLMQPRIGYIRQFSGNDSRH